MRAAAAVMPDLAEGGPEAVAELTQVARERTEPVARDHRDGDALVFPMITYVVVGRP